MYNILIEVIIVLKNKLGITDPAELARRMNENGLIDIVGRGAGKKYKLK